MLKGELFNQEMVQAYLEKRKLHTCRPLPKDAEVHECTDGIMVTRPKKYPGEYCRFAPLEPKFHPGDYMYVRETWSFLPCVDCDERCGGMSGDFYGPKRGCYIYRTNYGTTEDDSFPPSMFRWHPSIHMPREAARLFFRVTKVKVMWLDDVDEQFAREDGFETDSNLPAVGKFNFFWQTQYGPAAPWMWVYWTEPCSREEAMADGRTNNTFSG